SPATRATSPWACTTTERRAKSSSRCRKKARRFPASWTGSPWRFPSGCNTACRSSRSWKFINTRFDPSGYTPNHDIRYAKSVLDYIGRWLGGKFISRDYLTSALPAEAGENGAAVAAAPGSAMTESLSAPGASPSAEDAPTCSNGGSLMTRNGSCYKGGNCGETSGCS